MAVALTQQIAVPKSYRTKSVFSERKNNRYKNAVHEIYMDLMCVMMSKSIRRMQKDIRDVDRRSSLTI